MPKLLLADDHDLVRETLADYLSHKGAHVVITVNSFDAAFTCCDTHGPFDLVMLDYGMPGMNVLRGLERICAKVECPVALLSGSAPRDIARRALQMGAAGFLPKTLSPTELMVAVHEMLRGEVYIPLEFMSDPAQGTLSTSLTARERDVLEGLSRGHSNKEIAVHLAIQEVTVKLHLKTLSRKLGARNRTHAAMLARDYGLV